MGNSEINLATDMDTVIAEMTKILDWSYEQQSRLGFFPALYRQVTMRVHSGIQDQVFEDGDRMERLVVAFANRYLEAFKQYQHGEQLTKSWFVTFEAAKDVRYIILQHLLLGINAHINLDLGIAAADISTPDNLEALKVDFEHINRILGNLIDETQSKLGQFSPWINWLDYFAKGTDEKIAALGLQVSREAAWLVAQRCVRLSGQERAEKIKIIDGDVSQIAQLITHRSWFIRILVWIIQLRESKDVRKIINGLKH